MLVVPCVSPLRRVRAVNAAVHTPPAPAPPPPSTPPLRQRFAPLQLCAGLVVASLWACAPASAATPAPVVASASATPAAAAVAPAVLRRHRVFVATLKLDAARAGVSVRTLRRLDALSPAVAARARQREPPHSMPPAATEEQAPARQQTVQEYLQLMIDDARVARGAALLHTHAAALAAMRDTYGVPPSARPHAPSPPPPPAAQPNTRDAAQVAVAIWGIESGFGDYGGDHDAVEALAGLAADPGEERAEYFRGELLVLLQLIDGGATAPAGPGLRSSWAGALGQCQFMPSSLRDFAVDWDGDGVADVWGSPADILASISNFLARHGWERGAALGARADVAGGALHGEGVRLGLDDDAAQRLVRWQELGVTPVAEAAKATGEGAPPLATDDEAWLLAPDGLEGVAWLAGRNFRALLRYNHSVKYAIAVNQLAAQIDAAAEAAHEPAEADTADTVRRVESSAL